MINHGWETWFGKLIAIGEFAIGLGLIFGCLLGVAAFFGIVLNLNFMLAGTGQHEPDPAGPLGAVDHRLQGRQLYGLDRWVLNALGTPWSPGQLFRQPEPTPTASPAD